MKVLAKLQENIVKNIKTSLDLDFIDISLDLPPNKQFGDYAFSCFDLAKLNKTSPNQVATKLAKDFKGSELIKEVKAVGPYLNLLVTPEFIKQALLEINGTKNFGNSKIGQKQKVLLEFSGPNTNKPQHVGHLRNNCIGQSLVNIFRATGHQVIATNIINNRGIHIVKSMLMWQEFGQGATPQSTGLKGDHLVGQYYVMFNKLLKEEQTKYYQTKKIELTKLGNLAKRKTEDDFLSQSTWMKKARAMLQAWENNDPAVRKIWSTMNSWVYQGYDQTYGALGIKFDHIDYESDTYLLGRDIVELGLKKKVFYQEADGSVWIDLTKEGLDKKIVLRSDGTSVYITQDLGTAQRRYQKFKFAKAIYVVANEQDYHFKILFLILKKLGFAWANNLYHLSYGMVNLLGARIKSREGKKADADDLMETVFKLAKEKLRTDHTIPEPELDRRAKIIGLAAIKFFMLSVNKKNDIMFDPQESLSFRGHTGPYLLYTIARINGILKKANICTKINKIDLSLLKEPKELLLVKTLTEFPKQVSRAVNNLDPIYLSNYLIDLAQIFNTYYHQHSTIKSDDELKKARLVLIKSVLVVLTNGLQMMGIETLEEM